MPTYANRFLVPLNRAAMMSQLQLMTSQGYYWWHSGSVSADKAGKLLEKFVGLYPILATASQRSTCKKKKIANVSLLMTKDALQPGHIVWFLQASAGKKQPGENSFRDLIFQREKMKDCREVPLLWNDHYQLHRRHIEQPENERFKAKRRGKTTWTWSFTPVNLAGWRYQVAQAGQAGDRALQAVFSHLITTPLFAGIRRDLFDLQSHARASWDFRHCSNEWRPPLPLPLPTMPRIPVFGDLTLSNLVIAVEQEQLEKMRRSEAQALAAL